MKALRPIAAITLVILAIELIVYLTYIGDTVTHTYSFFSVTFVFFRLTLMPILLAVLVLAKVPRG